MNRSDQPFHLSPVPAPGDLPDRQPDRALVDELDAPTPALAVTAGDRFQAALTLARRHWPSGLLVAAGIAGVFLVLALISALIQGASHLVGGTAGWASHLPAWPILRTITDPIQAYLAGHATGLPLSAQDAGWVWLCASVGFFLLAALGARSARIGWIVLGVLTVAMVYAGTPHRDAPVAAGLTVVAWAVLSLPALRHLPTGGPEVVVVPSREPSPRHLAVPDEDDANNGVEKDEAAALV